MKKKCTQPFIQSLGLAYRQAPALMVLTHPDSVVPSLNDYSVIKTAMSKVSSELHDEMLVAEFRDLIHQKGLEIIEGISKDCEYLDLIENYLIESVSQLNHLSGDVPLVFAQQELETIVA